MKKAWLNVYGIICESGIIEMENFVNIMKKHYLTQRKKKHQHVGEFEVAINICQRKKQKHNQDRSNIFQKLDR